MAGTSSVIVTLSGASGAGKTTLARAILDARSDFSLVISTTTRPPRSSDMAGEYRYIDEDEFFAREGRGEFLWSFAVHGIHVGTIKADLEAALGATDRFFLMLLLPETLPVLMRYAPGRVHSIYVYISSRKELQRRLEKRGDDAATAVRRIEDCREWDKAARASGVPYHFVLNDGSVERVVRAIIRKLPKKNRL